MKTLLVDGNNLVWRNAHKIPPLTTPFKERIEVVYGFLKSLHSYLEQFEPTTVLCCWDSGRPLYRLSWYPDYKAHRQKTRDEASEAARKERRKVIDQISILQELLPLLGIKQIAFTNTEADDLIATAACTAKLGLRIIISGDRDFFQLVDKNVRVWNPNHHFLYTRKNFQDKLKMTPAEWYAMRALSGDSSDNIPPVRRGIGEKTALKIVRGKKIPWTKEMKQQHRINGELMYLQCVNNIEQLGAVIDLALKKHTQLKLAKVKRFFLDRAFVSILKDFPTWIQPFKLLGND